MRSFEGAAVQRERERGLALRSPALTPNLVSAPRFPETYWLVWRLLLLIISDQSRPVGNDRWGIGEAVVRSNEI